MDQAVAWLSPTPGSRHPPRRGGSGGGGNGGGGGLHYPYRQHNYHNHHHQNRKLRHSAGGSRGGRAPLHPPPQLQSPTSLGATSPLLTLMPTATEASAAAAAAGVGQPWLWTSSSLLPPVESAGVGGGLRALAPGIVGLHEELLLFHAWIKPTPREALIREQVVERLRAVVHRLWPEARLEVFGSSRTGLYLPTSDIDLVLFGRWEVLPLRALERALKEDGCATDVQVLDRATVPIVKLRDASSGLSIDVSFNMPNGVRAAVLIAGFQSLYPCLAPLVTLLKLFLLQRDLNQVWTGGISSYALTLLVVSFLQLHYRRHDLTAPVSQLNLGALLLEFLELYGRHFNYLTTAIRLSDGGAYVPKEEVQRDAASGRPSVLCIEDPLTPGNDIGRSSYGALQVKQAFEFAYLQLHRAVLLLQHQRQRQEHQEQIGVVGPVSPLAAIVCVGPEMMRYRQWAAAAAAVDAAAAVKTEVHAGDD